MTDIAVYVDSKLLPPVEEILQGVVPKFPTVTGVEMWSDSTDRSLPVLVLGNMPPITPAFFVKTLSQKQLLTNPAAITELEVAIGNLLAPPTFAPMSYQVVSLLTGSQEAALGNLLVVDIETGGRFDEAIRPSEKYLLAVGINDGRNIYVYREESVREHTAGAEQLARILTKPGRKLIAHNMKFDFPILGVHLGIPGLHGHADTMLMHHAINHGAKEHGLKPLAQKYLGAPEWEADQKQYVRKAKDFAAIPRDILYEYNAYDVYWTWHLFQYLLKIVKSDERIARTANFEFRMSTLFQDIEANGVGVDLPYLAELDENYTAQQAESLTVLRDMTGDDTFNPGSPQQVSRWFAGEGYQLKSTDEKTLEATKFDDSVQRFVDELLRYREYAKMLGTYVHGIDKRRRGNIVYPTFYVHGTSTGRLSSRDPNIQNIPRDKALRKLFVPRAPARTMVQVDYSQAELRVMACLSGDAYLRSLFQVGSPDFFDALMPVAYPGIDLATIAPGVKKDLRAKLKGVIYGMSYGRQAKAIAVSLDMAVQEAAKIMENYFKQAPELYAWRQEVSRIAIDPDAILVNPFGRRYQAEVVTVRNRQNVINSGLAFLPQSTASDMCASAAMTVQAALTDGLFGDTMIVATIHDAILLDVPDEHVDSVATFTQKAMEDSGTVTFGNLVHFGAEASTGSSWGTAD